MDFVLGILFNTAFIWVPIILGIVFWSYWMSWRQGMYRTKQKWTLLEISVPKEVYKPPQAMEIVLSALNDSSGVGTSWKKYVDGAIPHEFSLEMVSIEGSIYFFIRTQEKFKELIKNQIYSQYPQAEVHEVEDYTKFVGDYTQKQDRWELFGVEFELTAEDDFPIKTYVDYGLDQNIELEEKYKIDPLGATLEFLGSLRKDEQVWIQMIIRSDKWSNWRKEAVAKIHELMGESKDEDTPAPRMTEIESTQIKAIHRSLQKQAFEVGFRGVYLSRSEAFRPSNIAGLIGSVRHYNSPHLNGFKPGPKTDYDYLYQDFSGTRLPAIKRKFFNNYINRAFFNGAELDRGEKEKKPFVLTSEEIVTMFRFPGKVIETASLERIESTKTEAPTNLPI